MLDSMLTLPLVRRVDANVSDGRALARARRRRRRRLSAVGLISERLSGDLMSRGYYAITVMVGTPPQRFSLIVDTGSSITALPCAECESCGAHANPPFVPASSLTFRHVGCSEAQYSCTSCQGDACEYHVSYQEGSSYSGYLASDVVRLGAGDGCAALRFAFGCATAETGHFRSQQADGIMGLASSRRIDGRPAGVGGEGGGSGRGDGRGLRDDADTNHRDSGSRHKNSSQSTRSSSGGAGSSSGGGNGSRQLSKERGEARPVVDSIAADSVLGLARSPTVLEALVARDVVEDGFSLCISRTGGYLSFGLPTSTGASLTARGAAAPREVGQREGAAQQLWTRVEGGRSWLDPGALAPQP